MSAGNAQNSKKSQAQAQAQVTPAQAQAAGLMSAFQNVDARLGQATNVLRGARTLQQVRRNVKAGKDLQAQSQAQTRAQVQAQAQSQAVKSQAQTRGVQQSRAQNAARAQVNVQSKRQSNSGRQTTAVAYNAQTQVVKGPQSHLDELQRHLSSVQGRLRGVQDRVTTLQHKPAPSSNGLLKVFKSKKLSTGPLGGKFYKMYVSGTR
jgi:chromosome segregation ATPase